MGLAGSFGEQNYHCKQCGTTTALYSPHCPKCLNQNLTKVTPDKKPGMKGLTSGPRDEAEPSSGSRFGGGFALVAGAVVVFVALYTFFVKPSAQNPSRPAVTSTPSSSQQPRPRRVVRRTAAQSSTRASSASLRSVPVPPPSPARPMKLWQVTDSADEE